MNTLMVVLTVLSLLATLMLWLELRKVEPAILKIGGVASKSSGVVDTISSFLGVS